MIKITSGAAMAAAALLAGCGGSGGGGGGGGTTPEAMGFTYISQGAPNRPDNALTPAALQVTRRDNGTYRFEVTEGYDAGQVFVCSDDLSALDCRNTDPQAEASFSYGEIVGDHAATALFRTDFDGYYTTTAAFGARDPDAATTLPTGSVAYEGTVQGGGLIGDETGGMTGTVALDVRFDSGRVDGIINAELETGATMTAAWTGAEMDAATGDFAQTDDDAFTVNGEPAQYGDVFGGIFGPNGEEAAGAARIGIDGEALGNFVFVADQD